VSSGRPVRPIDTTAGRVLTAVVAPIMAVGILAVRMDRDTAGPWWGWGLLGLAALITGVFMVFWNRGYFGHAQEAARAAEEQTEDETD
jgi:hypothetical protein